MYFDTKLNNHGLAHNPFKAIVAPRPIGWISSRSASGEANLAPYSFFNGVGSIPPLVMFSSDGVKDSLKNVEETGVFACNFVSRDHTDEMNATSAPAPRGVSEFDLAGLEMVVCEKIECDRVKSAYAVLECKVLQIVNPTDVDGNPTPSHIVIGQVLGIHVDEAVITDGRFDVAKARPLARLGYMDYAHVEEKFELLRPDYPDK
ncbi:MAG: flavin reductase family protein [Pseudomonadota bacterium]